MVHASLLSDRAVLSVTGAEARDFLQGLITSDMAGCVDGRALYAALLTPQGKILFDFFVVPDEENRFLVDCAAARAGDLIKRLMLYRLRAKVEIASRPDLAVAGIWGEGAPAQAPANTILFADPRHPALGFRIIGTEAALSGAMRGFALGDYDSHRLELGVPDSADLPPDQVFALDAGMEELNGVNFKKGCYVGQEVTARMHHRSTARRRFVMAALEGDLPPAGTAIESEGRELGTLATGKAGHALALVRLDRLAEAQEKHAPITAAGRTLLLKKSEWFDG